MLWVRDVITPIWADAKLNWSDAAFRSFVKWYFDLLKNAAVVAVLYAAAYKSGFLAFQVAAGLSFVLINWYVLSFRHSFDAYFLRVYGDRDHAAWRSAKLASLLGFCALAASMLALQYEIVSLIVATLNK